MSDRIPSNCKWVGGVSPDDGATPVTKFPRRRRMTPLAFELGAFAVVFAWGMGVLLYVVTR